MPSLSFFVIRFSLVLCILISCDRSRTVSVAATCDEVAVSAQTASHTFGQNDGDVEVTVTRTRVQYVPIVLPLPLPYAAKPVLAEKP